MNESKALDQIFVHNLVNDRIPTPLRNRPTDLLDLQQDPGSYFSLLARDIILYCMTPYLAPVSKRTCSIPIRSCVIRPHPQYSFIATHENIHGPTAFNLYGETLRSQWLSHLYTWSVKYCQTTDVEGKSVIADCMFESNDSRTKVIFSMYVNQLLIRSLTMNRPVWSWIVNSTTLFYLTNDGNLNVQPFEGQESIYPIDELDLERLEIVAYSCRYQGPIIYRTNSPTSGELLWLDDSGHVQERLVIPVEFLAIYETATQRRIVCFIVQPELHEVQLQIIYWDGPCDYQERFTNVSSFFSAAFDSQGILYVMASQINNGQLTIWA